GAVAVPEGSIRRSAECAAKNARANGSRAGNEAGQLFDERGVVGADGGEMLRMAEGKMKGAVASHGDAGNRAIGAAGTGAIVALDEGEKFLEQEIVEAALAVAGIDVEAGAARRRGNQEFLELPLFPQILDQVPAAGMEKHLLVVAEAVKKVENRVAAGFLRIIRRRQEQAIRNSALEDLAGKRIAFDTSRCRGRGNTSETGQTKEAKESQAHQWLSWR